jgi:BirA family biotin operon repressor/biotin-[acetyl-CoA-carboxylase] ligase
MERQLIGSKVHRIARIDSTNRYAMEYLEQHDLPDGSLILAVDQFSGKGMQDNSWESEPGKNLTFSIVLYTDFLPSARQFMLNKVFSLALRDFAFSLLNSGDIMVKWPNDLYIGLRKAAGMLIQNTILGNELVRSVVGIGININQDVFRSGAPNPVSFLQVTGREYDLDRCLIDLCGFMDDRYRQLREDRFEEIDRDYLSGLLHLGEYHPYDINKRRIEARITGVDEFGRLILETRDRKMIVADQKEVEFVLKGERG